jgi:1-deoxy-D-xylulose-5-phosphate synthase
MKSLAVLDSICGPDDIKALSMRELEQLAGEIRARIISTVSGTGGHLASNLGAVEITLALHRTFASPRDSIVWDVGHQCYAHKNSHRSPGPFDTLRQEGAVRLSQILGKRHDSFISGHASTALAVAYGLSRARSRQGQAGHVVAVVGDGAMTGGWRLKGSTTSGGAARTSRHPQRQ